MNKRQKKKYGMQIIKPSEVWSLKYTLACYILPRLKLFKKENVNSYPQDFSSLEEWHIVIDKMIFSMEVECGKRELKTNEYEKFIDGYTLFGKYFKDLWD